MKKVFFCVSLVLSGLMTSCIDKYEEVDADSKPSWLGGSIYSELKNPNQARLTGTFNTYLRLIDDLGYAETLNRTGSKTVFPANDEAFKRFFSDNQWGVGSYEELTEAQKKLLLYTSMLDNALLLSLLPNVSNGSAEPDKGEAVKHATNVSIIDTIQSMTSADMPKGTTYWDKYAEKGIKIVSDATKPTMVHLTREYMLSHDITTQGDESDFAVITGTPFTEGTAYVFNDRVINGDITCQNGYIHQMEDVLVPPGNMAQVLRRHQKMTLFNRILDHYAAPFYDENTTRQYNDWAKANGRQQIDSIYQLRYLSTRSQGGNALTRDPLGNDKSSYNILSYDPGWNQYYPEGTDEISDLGAFFVPNDNAVKTYFLPGGGGSHLIDIYGDRENTEANLMENLDSLHAKKPDILASFCRNLMKPRFTTTVPSKFPNVTNDVSENMGLTMSLLDKKDDGKYDITIANNGVVYLINEMIVPDEFRSVMAPATEYPDMKIMGWAVKDGYNNGDYLGLDFQYYLKAMSANYAFFIPEDKAFDYYYLDPASLGHLDTQGKLRPDVLHIYYDSTATKQPYVKCARYYYDLETGTIDNSVPREVGIKTVQSQMQDILNTHTLVLESGAEIGQNHYYKTKHGGEVYVDGNNVVGTHVMSGMQKSNIFYNVTAGQTYDLSGFGVPEIKWMQSQKNGHSYRLDRVIQPTVESVYAVLKGNAVFSEFLDACTGFQATELLKWAGIDDSIKASTMTSEQDAYTIFTNNSKLVVRKVKYMDKDGVEKERTEIIPNTCIDYNVKMFNTYNYTLFAPDNTAMSKAYAEGLPKWSDVVALYNKYPQEEEHDISAAEKNDMETAKKMIRQIRDFIRYHFVTNSVYADNHVDGGRFLTLSADNVGVAKEVRISGGNGQLTVNDMKAGHSVTVSATDAGRMVNKMARDYWFNNTKTSATAIVTSSFCAIHQISEPLYGNASGKFNE